MLTSWKNCININKTERLQDVTFIPLETLTYLGRGSIGHRAVFAVHLPSYQPVFSELKWAVRIVRSATAQKVTVQILCTWFMLEHSLSCTIGYVRCTSVFYLCISKFSLTWSNDIRVDSACFDIVNFVQFGWWYRAFCDMRKRRFPRFAHKVNAYKKF